MMMSAGCNILVQLGGMNNIRISGCFLFIKPRNSYDLYTNQQSINHINCCPYCNPRVFAYAIL